MMGFRRDSRFLWIAASVALVLVALACWLIVSAEPTPGLSEPSRQESSDELNSADASLPDGLSEPRQPVEPGSKKRILRVCATDARSGQPVEDALMVAHGPGAHKLHAIPASGCLAIPQSSSKAAFLAPEHFTETRGIEDLVAEARADEAATAEVLMEPASRLAGVVTGIPPEINRRHEFGIKITCDDPIASRSLAASGVGAIMPIHMDGSFQVWRLVRGVVDVQLWSFNPRSEQNHKLAEKLVNPEQSWVEFDFAECSFSEPAGDIQFTLEFEESWPHGEFTVVLEGAAGGSAWQSKLHSRRDPKDRKWRGTMNDVHAGTYIPVVSFLHSAMGSFELPILDVHGDCEVHHVIRRGATIHATVLGAPRVDIAHAPVNLVLRNDRARLIRSNYLESKDENTVTARCLDAGTYIVHADASTQGLTSRSIVVHLEDHEERKIELRLEPSARARIHLASPTSTRRWIRMSRAGSFRLFPVHPGKNMVRAQLPFGTYDVTGLWAGSPTADLVVTEDGGDIRLRSGQDIEDASPVVAVCAPDALADSLMAALRGTELGVDVVRDATKAPAPGQPVRVEWLPGHLELATAVRDVLESKFRDSVSQVTLRATMAANAQVRLVVPSR